MLCDLTMEPHKAGKAKRTAESSCKGARCRPHALPHPPGDVNGAALAAAVHQAIQPLHPALQLGVRQPVAHSHQLRQRPALLRPQLRAAEA